MTATTRFERRGRRNRFTARRAAVQAVRRPVEGFVRVTVGGPDFSDFESTGPADHVRLFFPDDDGVLVAPVADPSGDGIIRPDALTINRDYTPLRPRTTPDGGTIDLDFVEHEHAGPATRWAMTAAPGDEIVVVGPRGSKSAPVDADGLLLIVDATALPSASRWIADVGSIPTTVIAALDRDEDWLAAYLEVDDRVDLRIARPDPGGDALVAAVAETSIEAGDFVFAAGEATAIARVRRHLLDARGLPSERVAISGYWRRGAVGFDHHTPLDD